MRKSRIIMVALTATFMFALHQGAEAAESGVKARIGGGGYYTERRTAGTATWSGTIDTGGTFTFEATATSSTRSGSCVPKTATGDLTITWDDGSTTVARDLLARSHGTKELAFTGTTDRTSDMFAGAKIKGTVEYPNSVSRETAGCDPGTALIQARIQRIRGAI